MDRIPDSLAIALWLMGSMWVVGMIAYMGGAEIELVAVTLIAGIIAGVLEYFARRKMSG